VLLLRLFYGTLLHACPLLRWFLLSYLKTLGGEEGAGVVATASRVSGQRMAHKWTCSSHGGSLLVQQVQHHTLHGCLREDAEG
jgi:hypothetical protein